MPETIGWISIAVVISCDLVEISSQRGFACNDLREIAARSRQRFDEGRSRPSVLKYASASSRSWPGGRWARCRSCRKKYSPPSVATPALLENLAGEIFVRCQRRGGGVVLRIPRASPGAEMNGFGPRGDAEDEARCRRRCRETPGRIRRRQIPHRSTGPDKSPAFPIEIPSGFACISGSAFRDLSNDFRARQLTARSAVISAS